MHGLGEGDKDGRNAELVVCEVLHDVSVEAENAELVSAHDAGEKLHNEDFVVEGEALVIFVEDIVQLLAERLRVVE